MGHLTTNYKTCIFVGFKSFMKKWYDTCWKFALWIVAFMEMHTFYKKLPLFIKNSILHIYKKLEPLIWAFIKNSIFGNNRDPCLLLGLLQLVRLALPFCLNEDLQHLLPSAHGAKLARLVGQPGLKNLIPSLQLLLQLAPLLALPSHFSAISAGLRKQEPQLVSLLKWLVILCILPSLLSLFLLLPLFLQPVSTGPQALIFGQPLHLIWAGLDLLTTALGSSQVVVSKKLIKSWKENEKRE